MLPVFSIVGLSTLHQSELMRLSGASSKIRIQFFLTLRANTVTEISFRMLNKIMFNRIPIVLIVSDVFAV